MTRLPNISEIQHAIVRARTEPTALSEKELQSLISILHASYNEQFEEQYDNLAEQYAETTEEADDLQQEVVIAISLLPAGVAIDLVPELIRYLEDDPQFYELAHALVAITFPMRDAAVSIDNALQKEALTAVLRNHDIWDHDTLFPDYLIQRGLPRNRKDVETLVSKAAQIG